MRLFAWVLVLFGAFFGAVVATGCGLNCDRAGCISSITLNVRDASGANVSAFKGEVSIDGETAQVDCGSGTPATSANVECGAGFARVSSAKMSPLPGSVSVKLTSADGTKSFDGTVSPEDRKTFQPNGPECDPTCESATATVTLE